MKQHLPNGDQSALWKEINSLMEFLVIVVNSNRNFFRVKGGVAAEVEDYLIREDLIVPGAYDYAREELIQAICAKLEEYIDP